MIYAESKFLDCINAPARHVLARVELYEGSTLIDTFKHTDSLQSVKIERLGEKKFFGFGICQKMEVKLVDRYREINNIDKNKTLEIAFGAQCDYVYAFPNFYVDDVKRDENTNELTIVAYDALYNANNHTVSELNLSAYTIKDFVLAIAALLKVPVNFGNIPEDDVSLNTLFPDGANFNGQERIREALNKVAEATQSIYYINHNWELTFRRLDKSGAALFTIDKPRYFTLDSKDTRTLTAIAHATELGDNVISGSGTDATQYVRNNPFWEKTEYIGDAVDSAMSIAGGLAIAQFNCEWRGNYLLEIGDKINIITKDDGTITSFLLEDTIEYTGGLRENTSWSYEDNQNETAANPSTLGEALKLTSAKVDKTNNTIELIASSVDSQADEISKIKIDTEGITSSVSTLQDTTEKAIGDLSSDFTTLEKSVETKMTDEQVSIKISEALSNGVDKVETSTGFTFNDEGLTVDKSDSEMKTTITEDGMKVYKNDNEVLIADHDGVKAEDLHATTFLIIGANSRFEDYGNRTACFWIGGNS
jgi:hypothetical protein